MLLQFRARSSISDHILLYVRFIIQQRECFIVILLNDAWLVSLGVLGIFLNICSEPIIREFNIIWCTTMLSVLHKICPIWVYYALPHEYKCVKIVIKHKIKLR